MCVRIVHPVPSSSVELELLFYSIQSESEIADLAISLGHSETRNRKQNGAPDIRVTVHH